MSEAKKTRAPSSTKPRKSKKDAVSNPIIEEVIAHLPINSSMLTVAPMDLIYNPEVPMLPDAYNNDTTTVFANYTDTSDSKQPIENEADIALAKIRDLCDDGGNHLPQMSFEQMVLKYKTKETYSAVPSKVTQNCFWDGHYFVGQPFVIPNRIVREEDGKPVYEVESKFCCSPECCAAQLFKGNSSDSFSKWEKYALMNQMYKQMYKIGHAIRPAPDRELLESYGGTLSIIEYRKLVRQGHIRIDLIAPPMIAVNAVLDIKPADYYESHVTNAFIPVDTSASTSGTIGSTSATAAPKSMRLQRKNPKPVVTSSLDKVMMVKKKDVGAITTSTGETIL